LLCHRAGVILTQKLELDCTPSHSDSSKAVTAVLAFVMRIDALSEAKKQAKYVEAMANNASAPLPLLPREYKPFAPRLIKAPKWSIG